MNTVEYAYRVIWSPEDQEFVGLCSEFPSLSWLDATQQGALAGVVELVRATLADMRASGEVAPEPFSSRRFSGRFMVRVTPELHRRLAMLSAEAGVSLNRFVNSRLSQ